MGQSNSQLRSDRSGSPYLLYTDGAFCDGQNKWTTRIEFVCANNATKDNGTANGNANSNISNALGPKIIENKNCQLLIHFQTPLACHEQIACKVKVYVEHSEDGTGEEVVDLTPLISATDNYEAEINNASITEQQVPKSTKVRLCSCSCVVVVYAAVAEVHCQIMSAPSCAQIQPSAHQQSNISFSFQHVFNLQYLISTNHHTYVFVLAFQFFLNVCRPLVPKFGLGCPGGSAACMAKVASTSATPEEEKVSLRALQYFSKFLS